MVKTKDVFTCLRPQNLIYTVLADYQFSPTCMKRTGRIWVKYTAGICCARSSRSRGWGQRCSWRVWCRCCGFSLALWDATVTNFSWLLLQGCRVSHGTWPWIRWANTRGLERVAVLFGLKWQKGNKASHKIKTHQTKSKCQINHLSLKDKCKHLGGGENTNKSWWRLDISWLYL